MLAGLGERGQGSAGGAASDVAAAESAAQKRWQAPARKQRRKQDKSDGNTWEKYAAEKRRRAQRGAGRGEQGAVRVGGGLKIPAGGAPAGSRLGAMVGDVEYYEQQARTERTSQEQQRGGADKPQ